LSGQAAKLAITALGGVKRIRPGDDLCALAIESLAANGETLRDGDILVLAQKIVSKSESRYADLGAVTPSAEAIKLAGQVNKDARLVELILGESREIVRHRPGVLIVLHRLGYVMANAGIDASNVEPEFGEDTVLLLPEDSDASAEKLRVAVLEATGVRIGVVINDSLGRAWRNGTMGVALGVAGIPGVMDLRGREDLMGRELRVSEIGVADEIAAAASIVMGQADEGRPLVHIRGFPYPSGEGSGAELIRDPEMDLFR
jgi:coenzyme F420-0:L-glutamate ligase / coenzyme F420-1:gamma-L-glutamate ligase